MIEIAGSCLPLDATMPSQRAGDSMTTVGTAAAFGAVLAAASCCVLPFALAGLGLGTALSSTFDALMPMRWPLMTVSVLGLVGGLWSYAKRRRACAAGTSCGTPAPSRATPAILSIGMILILIAILWDRLEPSLMRLLS